MEKNTKQAPTNNPIEKNFNKGEILEYRIKRLLFHMGYYAQTNVILKTSQELPNDIITDLDVYGYIFTSDFSKSITWVDCKSGNANVLKHIGWINGIKSQFNIDNTIFIKQGVRKNIKEYSRSLGIKVFDLSMLDTLEKNYGIEKNDWSGSYDITMQNKQLRNFTNIKTPDTSMYKNIANFMTSTYWSLDHFSRVKKSITGLKQLSKSISLPLREDEIISIKWAIYNLTSLFLLATIEICGDMYYFSDNDKRLLISEGLVSGTIPPAKRQELADMSHRVAVETIKQYIPDFNDSTLKKINPNLPPNYYEAYCDLIIRMTKDPLNWTKSLHVMDYFLMEYDLKKQVLPDGLFDKYVLDSDGMSHCIKTVFHFLIKTTFIPKELFSLL